MILDKFLGVVMQYFKVFLVAGIQVSDLYITGFLPMMHAWYLYLK